MNQKILRGWFPIFVLPTLLAFIVAFAVPFFLGVGLSFTEFTTVTNAKWCGITNYLKAFSDGGAFLRSLSFTSLFAAVSVLTVNILAFILALLLTRGLRGTHFFRSLFFLPNLIGGIVLGYIFNLLINGILARFGVDITFQASYGFFGLVLLTSWQLIGYMMVIYIAGLQSIPDDLLEAAAIDGASPLQALVHIKIPTVMPAITVCTFLTLTNAFKMFDQNLALTGGAPEGKTAMLALDIFNTFYGKVGRQGVGQAKAVIFFLIVALLAFLQLKLTSRGGETD